MRATRLRNFRSGTATPLSLLSHGDKLGHFLLSHLRHGLTQYAKEWKTEDYKQELLMLGFSPTLYRPLPDPVPDRPRPPLPLLIFPPVLPIEPARFGGGEREGEKESRERSPKRRRQ